MPMPMPRPEALGLTVSIASLADADLVLHELAWLANERAKLDAVTKQKIDAAKQAAVEKSIVEVEGETLSFDAREASLIETLNAWVSDNIAGHLPAKKKSVDLPHGTLGLRQQPQIAEFGEGETVQSILDRIDQASGLVTAVNGILARNVASIGKSVQGRDLLKIVVTPANKGMLEAVEAKRLTEAQLAEFGLFLRAAYDEPVIKPAKTIVSAEAA